MEVHSEHSEAGEGDGCWAFCRKHMKIILFVVVMTVISLFLTVRFGYTKAYIQAFLEWVEEAGVSGMAVFVLVYAVAGTIFFPILVLTLGAGYIYSSIYNIWLGLVVATVIVFFGSFIAACISMPVGRYILRNFLQERIKHNRKYMAMEEAINEYGFTLVSLWRLPPILPFTIFNYLVGISSISYKDYVLASFAMIPSCFVEVYIGTSISSIQETVEGKLEGGAFTLGAVIGGLVIALAGMTYVSILAKRRIDEILFNCSLLSSPSRHDGSIASRASRT